MCVFQSCVNVASERHTINGGWYVDTDRRHMRLDSYGVPEGRNGIIVSSLVLRSIYMVTSQICW